jgi:excisionase family DNA binding protein
MTTFLLPRCTGEFMVARMITSPADYPRPLTVKEISESIPCGLNQAYDLVRRGEIKSIRVGTRILIPQKAFLAWLNGDTQGAA